MRLKGLVTNVLTPMDNQGHPDNDGIHALVDYLVSAGIGGLWVLGSAGEDVHLSAPDKAEVIHSFLAAGQGRVPMVMGLGTETFHDYMILCDNIETDKVDAFHFLPYDQKIGDQSLVRYVEKLADVLPCPLWLYHNPKRGRGFTLEIVRILKQHPNIIGIKVGGYSLTDLTRMMMLEDDKFQVAGAGGGQLFQMLSLGAQVHMTSDSNCFPEVFLELISLFQQGKKEEALALQYDIIRFLSRIPHTDNGEYAAEEKYIVTLRGVRINEYVNPAYRCLTNDEKQTIQMVLQEQGFSWA
ncbi:MAG: dihydrodipicolinate synthase family protein [Candidatus Electrothrix sp. AX2]|nr:dihydrodipicolinate synthase family protein [Candidatus Electrothrix gigas]